MLGSIRWKLAASYALLVLLSVSLMGALALYFVQHNVKKEEQAYLKANAQAVALQAERYFDPHIRRIALEELAATSAFLGDARVRIMDDEKALIADSGEPGFPDEFMWLPPSGLAEIDTQRRGGPPSIFPMPPRGRERPPRPPNGSPMGMFRDLPLGSSPVYARRMPTPWGRRFVFEGSQPPPKPQLPPPARQVLSITLPIGERSAPLGYVELSSPLSMSGQAVQTIRGAVAFSGLGSLVVAVVFGFLMGRTISNPLRALEGTARRMSAGDLTARAGETRKDEIGGLARQLNTMAASLETTFGDLRSERDALQRFIADASHELRTPITALSTFNELLQGTADADPKAREEFLRESQVQIARLQWITTNLLDLSRLDAGIASLDISEHPVWRIVESASAGLVERARLKGVAFSLAETDPALHLFCDKDRLALAVANLIGNAVKFTPPGGAVSVSARAAGDSIEITVEDSGPGIPAEDIPRIFERFFRGKAGSEDAAARSGTDSQAAEGSGLGLAIVQSVARAHGGSVHVQSRLGAGSTFILSVPRIPAGGPALRRAP